MKEGKGVWQNITDGRTWLRGLFMLLFVLIYSVTEVIITAAVVLQFLFVLFTGAQNPRLKEFGSHLSTFIYGIMSYWTYNSEVKPFPFAAWPGHEKK